MSKGARIGLLAGTLVALVLAFVLLSPEVDEESGTATTPTVAATATTPGEPADDSAQTTPEVTPAPAFTTIRVQGGKPVGGVETVTVRKGERVRVQVSSTNTTDEIHLHGYDLTRAMTAGDPVRFSFVANAEGIFEIELEGRHTQIGKLVVEP